MICGKSEGKLNLCNGCKIVRYCGTECQTSDWPIHKGVCPLLRQGKVSAENTLNQRLITIQLTEEQKRKTARFNRLEHATKLGDGNFSEIMTVYDPVEKETYALKIIEKQNLLRIRKEKDVFMEKHC